MPFVVSDQKWMGSSVLIGGARQVEPRILIRRDERPGRTAMPRKRSRRSTSGDIRSVNRTSGGCQDATGRPTLSPASGRMSE